MHTAVTYQRVLPPYFENFRIFSISNASIYGHDHAWPFARRSAEANRKRLPNDRFWLLRGSRIEHAVYMYLYGCTWKYSLCSHSGGPPKFIFQKITQPVVTEVGKLHIEQVSIRHQFIDNQILRVPMEYRLDKICKFTQLEVTKLFLEKYSKIFILKYFISKQSKGSPESLHRLYMYTYM